MHRSMPKPPALAQSSDLQRPTKDLSRDAQLSLIAEQAPAKPSAPVDRRYLFSLSGLRRAIRYSMSLRDLEPKQVYEALGKDAAAWSRIENGGISFPADDLPKLLEITGNDAPLRWLAHACGYEIVPMRSELEEQLEAERAHSADLQRRLDIITDFIRQTRP
jgi:hypothetical protein